MIDLYCERTAVGLWNEPFNAASNIAFVIVAILAWRNLGKRGYSDYWEKAVIALAAMIGLGSFLFHTFATNWAAQADIIPIWLFVGSYALLVIYRLSDENSKKTIAIAFLVTVGMLTLRALTTDNLGTGVVVSNEPSIFNGSLQYLPVLIALIAFSIAAHVVGHSIRNYLLLSTVLFFSALVFRTLDIASCEATYGTGTHFLWHLLNGCVMATLLQGLILKLPPGLKHQL